MSFRETPIAFNTRGQADVLQHAPPPYRGVAGNGVRLDGFHRGRLRGHAFSSSSRGVGAQDKENQIQVEARLGIIRL